ncbi:MAG: hypothetical protein DWQ04_15350 [Chloroflexi bacterium]|nr:MAG: hypothetical protein DWQ04_15350 [Chloroflexota bacterium]
MIRITRHFLYKRGRFLYYQNMIETLRYFFESNTLLVFFVYGQVFFVLGLAIALQSWRHSRLELARSLRWLAAFGIVHGIHEWGTIFIPMQAASETVLFTLLHIFQVFTLAISFGFLFQFGVDLFRQHWSWLIYLPSIVVICWGIVFVVPNFFSGNWTTLWHTNASIWARYLIGFPAGLLSAFGLRYQAEKQIKPLNLSNIYRTLQVAGLALGGYAIVSGLIVPPGNFFPANFLNSEFLATTIGIPAPILRSLAGLIIAVTVIRALEVFNVEVDRQIEQMQFEQNVMAERERIGRDLHDGAMQKVYTAGLMIESMRNKATDNEQLMKRIDRAMIATNEAIAGLRDYMVGLRPNPSSESLVEALQQQTADPQINTLVSVKLILDLPQTMTLEPIQTTRVLAILREALANAARHSQARQVTVKAFQEKGNFVLTIIDDGCGFLHGKNGNGYGLRDMRDQARLLAGQLRIQSEPNQGTLITLVVPWEDV